MSSNEAPNQGTRRNRPDATAAPRSRAEAKARAAEAEARTEARARSRAEARTDASPRVEARAESRPEARTRAEARARATARVTETPATGTRRARRSPTSAPRSRASTGAQPVVGPTIAERRAARAGSAEAPQPAPSRRATQAPQAPQWAQARRVADEAPTAAVAVPPARGGAARTPEVTQIIEAPQDEVTRRGRRRADVPVVPSASVVAVDLDADLDADGPAAAEPPATRRSRRAAEEPAKKEGLSLAGRTISTRRALAGAVAAALVLLIPGATVFSNGSASVADDSLLSGGTDASAMIQDPSPTLDPSQWRMSEPVATRVKPKVRKTVTATPAQRTTSSSSSSSGSGAVQGSAIGPLAGLNGKLSGLQWASGVYIPGSSPANAAAFGNWRGRPVDVVVDWSARANWDDIENPDWLLAAWKGTPYIKSFGVAPIPEDGSSSLGQCASGANNDHWRTFANNLKNSGYTNKIVVRLGWEFNGDWYKWSANNPDEFAGCWRQIVKTVRAIAPAVRWDWNVNRGKGKSVVDAADAYPGDDYVDIVGIDSYDQWPGATSQESWEEQYSGPYGLKHWVDFAKKHGKPFSVPEWGLYPTRGSASGGDNPYYMKKMIKFFEDNQANLAYEAYFDESADYYQGAIFSEKQNPVGAAAYKSGL